MGRAVYVATLTQCGSNLKQISLGTLNYAADNQTAYPDRLGASKPTSIKSGAADQRVLLRRYVAVSYLQCPLAPEKLDFDEDPTPANAIEVNYGFYWGWKFDNTPGYNERGLMRVGSTLTYKGNRFNVIAGDFESAGLSNEIAETSHNDYENSMPAWTLDNETYGGTVYKFSRWNQWTPGAGRGLMDKNFAMTDGSVSARIGLDLLHTTDPLMVEVPVFKSANTWSTFLPRQ